jgi:hypothetical protein
MTQFVGLNGLVMTPLTSLGQTLNSGGQTRQTVRELLDSHSGGSSVVSSFLSKIGVRQGEGAVLDDEGPTLRL